jgi:hypothetical protein
MSQHFVERGKFPPGLSSFTKIRLGWVAADRVTFVEPGDSAIAFLSPLSKQGKTLAVKIPLSWGNYYLIENRQPVGFDRALPDAGLLVLKVNPHADEGSGTVKIMDASPSTPQFAKATWRMDAPGRDAYVDESNGLAVIPLWQEEGNLGVLITTPGKKQDALEAARAIEKLQQKGAAARLLEDCKESFRAYDFRKVLQWVAEYKGN